MTKPGAHIMKWLISGIACVKCGAGILGGRLIIVPLFPAQANPIRRIGYTSTVIELLWQNMWLPEELFVYLRVNKK